VLLARDFHGLSIDPNNATCSTSPLLAARVVPSPNGEGRENRRFGTGEVGYDLDAHDFKYGDTGRFLTEFRDYLPQFASGYYAWMIK
jgi:hypothetical protein